MYLVLSHGIEVRFAHRLYQPIDEHVLQVLFCLVIKLLETVPHLQHHVGVPSGVAAGQCCGISCTRFKQGIVCVGDAVPLCLFGNQKAHKERAEYMGVHQRNVVYVFILALGFVLVVGFLVMMVMLVMWWCW